MLQDPERHVNQTYSLTGPRELSLYEAADVLSKVTGRHFQYVDETIEEARESRKSYGAEEWLVEGELSILRGQGDFRIDTLLSVDLYVHVHRRRRDGRCHR